MIEPAIIVERRDRVGLIRLTRPETRNALSLEVRELLRGAIIELDADDGVGAIVITGSDEVFAAGADIRTLLEWSPHEARNTPELRGAWEQMGRCRKVVIAAVAGYALGAGCELAMMCDFILAADNAKFGQPEIKLGTIPGSGGTQRLTRLVGKSKAMELVLTGRMIDAEEAERCGLVSRVLPLAELLEDALKTASIIAEFSVPAVAMARDAVNRALETPLSEGLRYESRLFEATFGLEDRREGMNAFLDRRKPHFKNR